MTSKWIRSAPAASTLFTSSPRRAKSADRIEGAIQDFMAPAPASFHATRCAQQLIRRADLAGLLFGDFHHRLRQALRDQLVGMILIHETTIGLRDLCIRGRACNAEHFVRLRDAIDSRPSSLRSI